MRKQKRKLDFGIITLIFGVILIIFIPYLLTRTGSWISFENTGAIGDTIGGITAPVTGIIGAILIYLALNAQIKANQIVYDQFQELKKEEKYRKSQTYISSQVDSVRQEINEILYNTTRIQGDEKRQVDLKGTSAINETLLICAKINQEHFDQDIFVKIPNLTKIKLLLEKCESILNLIDNMGFADSDKIYLSDSIRFVYQIKLKPYLLLHENKRISKSDPCKNCGKVHDGIPEDIYRIFDRIQNKYEL